MTLSIRDRPNDKEKGNIRVLRGGSFNLDAPNVQSAYRYGNYPDYRFWRAASRAANAAAIRPSRN